MERKGIHGGWTIRGRHIVFLQLRGCNKEFLDELTSEYKIKDMGIAQWALGIHLIQKDGEATISQVQYAKDLAARYAEHLPTRQCRSPIGAFNLWDPTSYPDQTGTKSEYQEIYTAALGAVTYLMCGTRPDLAFSVALLARFSKCPSTEYWSALCHVLGYIRDTADAAITYRTGFGLSGFCDSNFGSDRVGRPISGRILTMAGGAVLEGGATEASRNVCV